MAATGSPALPVVDTAIAAYRSVFGHLMNPVRIALVPALIGILLFVMTVLGTGAPGQGPVSGVAVLLAILGFAGMIACLVAFASAWMRYLITSGPQDPAPIGFRFGPEEWRVLGYSLLLALIGVVILVPSGFVIGTIAAFAGDVGFYVGLAVVYGALIYIILRVMLAFPAAAVGRRNAWSFAWQISRGNVLRLLAAFALILVPFTLADWVVRLAIQDALLGLGDPQAIQQAVSQGDVFGLIVVILIGLVFGFFGAALQYAGLAQAYRNLTEPAGIPPAGWQDQAG